MVGFEEPVHLSEKSHSERIIASKRRTIYAGGLPDTPLAYRNVLGWEFPPYSSFAAMFVLRVDELLCKAAYRLGEQKARGSAGSGLKSILCRGLCHVLAEHYPQRALV